MFSCRWKQKGLLRMGLHVSDVIAGYEVAGKKALEALAVKNKAWYARTKFVDITILFLLPQMGSQDPLSRSSR